jgi:hypothetical protein
MITSALPAGTIRRRRTAGVPPIAISTESAVEVMDIDSQPTTAQAG